MTRTKTPLQAIREKCLDCCYEAYAEIKACSSLDCPLWEFRLGIHPFTNKNRLNPFLRRDNFEKLHNIEASKVIEIINLKR